MISSVLTSSPKTCAWPFIAISFGGNLADAGADGNAKGGPVAVMEAACAGAVLPEGVGASWP